MLYKGKGTIIYQTGRLFIRKDYGRKKYQTSDTKCFEKEKGQKGSSKGISGY